MSKESVKRKAKSEKVEKKEEVKVQNGMQVMRGRVISAKSPKTVTVLIEREKIHPLYSKAFKRSKHYLVHDELGVLEGDVVEIVKVKPISRNKHFQTVRVVGKDIEAIVTERLKEEAAQEIAEVMPEEKEESGADSQESSEKSEEEKETKKRKGKKA